LVAKAKYKQRDAFVLRARHRKAYRLHHVASLLLALAVVFAVTFELGIAIDNSKHSAPPVPAAKASKAPAGSPTVVRSAYGFSFSADSNTFAVSGTELDSNGQAQAVAQDKLNNANQKLVSATVRAKPGAVSGRVAATQLSIAFNPDPTALTAAEHSPENAALSPAQTAGKLFPVTASAGLDIKTLSSNADKLNSVPVQKTVYQFIAKQGGGKSYAIVWSGVSKGRAFAVELNGLAGRSTIPNEFALVLNSLNLSAGQAVLGASTSVFAPQLASANGKLDPKYLSDALSPAVVQIFHTVCGVLTVSGKPLGDSACVSFSGSGFLATQSGYIATNGHVVVYTAKDALADLVTSDDTVLQAYLQGLGLTPDQISATKSDPAALAAVIAKIYDLPDKQLNFANKGELTLVALGNDQPNTKKLIGLTTSAQLARFQQDTDTIKRAKVVAYNYDAKDGYTAVADPKAGFSSSDVALLKINVSRAPDIPVETDKVLQNEKVIVMGFPGDANNPLIDNRQTDVTVTDGVVSSIREAAGGKGKLYQSDADASHGNSGGPAIDDQGKAIGLMTYRYADTQNNNAAESYIRDIADFTDLASANHVTIDSRSTTQQLWEQGLELYSNNHYSAALKDFNKVQADYPAQRLVASYISSSKDAIADGKDVKDLPVDVLVIILAASLMALGATVVVIMRHHSLHRVYQASVPGTSGPQRPIVMVQPKTKSPPQPPDNTNKD
jgi:S1-C subfamily serine protease